MPFVAFAGALLGPFSAKGRGRGHFSVAHCPYRFLFDRLSHITSVIPVHGKKDKRFQNELIDSPQEDTKWEEFKNLTVKISSLSMVDYISPKIEITQIVRDGIYKYYVIFASFYICIPIFYLLHLFFVSWLK